MRKVEDVSGGIGMVLGFGGPREGRRGAERIPEAGTCEGRWGGRVQREQGKAKRKGILYQANVIGEKYLSCRRAAPHRLPRGREPWATQGLAGGAGKGPEQKLVRALLVKKYQWYTHHTSGRGRGRQEGHKHLVERE